MEPWEVRRRIALYRFTVALLYAEFQVVLFALVLSYCGIRWDEETGTFRKATERNA